MTILLDENLPHQLGYALKVDWVHASRIAGQATDTQLWEYAKENQMTILTKDTDFFDRLVMKGAPPKVIWIRA